MILRRLDNRQLLGASRTTPYKMPIIEKFGFRSPAASSLKEIERRKFCRYSLYSWGCPSVIFLMTLIMEMPWIPKEYIRPEFGVDKCWFKTQEANLLYFYLPLAVILISNLFFFIATTYKILSISKETRVLNHGESKRHVNENERQRFVLYLKLFIVMGINWMTELISFFYKDDLKYLWYLTDASNTLQGVLIFIIFVWKRKIIRLLKQKICPPGSFLRKTSTTRSKISPSKTTSNVTNHTSVNLSTSDSFKLKPISSMSTLKDRK